ncbi:MAG TPA: DegT/DnrJ/EryC1/StrS family aminotransferase [Gaiellaceae bacterium]|nr:DegT/DnrJ/EryC1/StrS family aminotransferase [Gaiellaceae bacterium]
MPQIPLVDVKAQYAPLKAELKERIAEVLDTGRFILGPNVRAFEEEAAAHLGAEHAIGVANGTDALVIALDALDIGPGDEVICPTFTFYATAESIARRGAKPVFVDIEARTMNLDPADVRARVSERTKAIIPVHLFGRPAALGELAELGIPIVEDAAQAFGGQGVGTTGVVSTYSFFPTKNLFALGDAGLMTTGDEELAERIRLLRFHGSKAKKDFELVGYNSRLDELQAAVLRLFLPHVEEWNRLRREAAARYAELGLGEVCELPEDEPGHVYHVFVVRSPERDRICEHLAASEIASSAYYETPLHRQPALRRFGQADTAFPETERASRENLALPMWAGIGADVQERVVSAVREAVSLEAVR